MSGTPKLTPKQQNFVDTLLQDPKKSPTQAAYETYNAKSRHVARQIARENLLKPAIVEYLAQYDKEAQQTIVEVMLHARQQKSSPTYQRLAKDSAVEILDRIHGKATAKVETKGLNLNLDIEPNPELGDAFTEFLKDRTKHQVKFRDV